MSFSPAPIGRDPLSSIHAYQAARARALRHGVYFESLVRSSSQSSLMLAFSQLPPSKSTVITDVATMITQIDYEDDSLEPGEAHPGDDIENQEAHNSEQLQFALKPAVDADAQEEEEDFAEEDAWLLACHFLDDDERERDSERYVPQLMDAREMRQLRATLRKSEMQIQTCGRLREFTPRKPVASPESHARRRNSNLTAQRPGGNNTVGNNNSSSDAQPQESDVSLTLGPTCAFLTAVPPTAALLSPSTSHRKQDFAVVLRRELRRVRGSCGLFIHSWC